MTLGNGAAMRDKMRVLCMLIIGGILAGILSFPSDTLSGKERHIGMPDKSAALQHHEDICASCDDRYGNMPDFPAFPSNLYFPDNTGIPLSFKSYRLEGYPLIVSNSPEVIDEQSAGKALFRTVVSSDRFRIFFHHQNKSSQKLLVGFSITNRGVNPVKVFLWRNSQGLPQAALGTSSLSPAQAGCSAYHNWLSSRVGSVQQPGENQDYWRCDLKPGESDRISESAPVSYTVTGMYDVALQIPSDNNVPHVAVTVFATPSAPQAPEKLAIAPPDTSPQRFPPLCRGLFHYHSRTAVIHWPLNGIYWLDLAGPMSGAYARHMTNEYLKSIPDPDNGKRSMNNPGNYGVLYLLTIILKNHYNKSLHVKGALSMAGGPGYVAAKVDEKIVESPGLLPAYHAGILGEWSLKPGEERTVQLCLTLPGGCPGAHRLYLWPSREGR